MRVRVGRLDLKPYTPSGDVPGPYHGDAEVISSLDTGEAEPRRAREALQVTPGVVLFLAEVLEAETGVNGLATRPTDWWAKEGD